MEHFRLIKTDVTTKARAGELKTPHGLVPTPVFVPVGSQGTVKTLTPHEILALKIPIILANTYHLYLRPGIEVIEGVGGLHKFMGWDGAILTDSGGYQVFSLAPLRQVSDEGVNFRSHIDGSQHFFTPELAIKFQEAMSADIIMALDDVPASDENLKKIKRAMERTHRWAERCQDAQQRRDQELYAIVQGGLSPELRQESAGYLTSLGFSGYAIGGLSLGEPKKITFKIVEETVGFLPEDKPRYLMGVGSPEDLLEAISRGCDIFDSALPTRVARNGALFTLQGRLNIQNSAFREVKEPIDLDCSCYTCRNFSAAYLSHLFNSGELLALRLATIHNLNFINCLISSARTAILRGTFKAFKKSFLKNYQTTNEEMRLKQKQQWLKSRRLSDNE